LANCLLVICTATIFKRCAILEWRRNPWNPPVLLNCIKRWRLWRKVRCQKDRDAWSDFRVVRKRSQTLV